MTARKMTRDLALTKYGEHRLRPSYRNQPGATGIQPWCARCGDYFDEVAVGNVVFPLCVPCEALREQEDWGANMAFAVDILRHATPGEVAAMLREADEEEPAQPMLNGS